MLCHAHSPAVQREWRQTGWTYTTIRHLFKQVLLITRASSLEDKFPLMTWASRRPVLFSCRGLAMRLIWRNQMLFHMEQMPIDLY